jgi:hypothetical protein
MKAIKKTKPKKDFLDEHLIFDMPTGMKKKMKEAVKKALGDRK